MYDVKVTFSFLRERLSWAPSLAMLKQISEAYTCNLVAARRVKLVRSLSANLFFKEPHLQLTKFT